MFATAVILLFLTAFASGGELLVSLDYRHSMRVLHSDVQVFIDADGVLQVTSESGGKDKAASRMVIPPERFRKLKRTLEGMDWGKITSEKTRGLDGTSVRISIDKHTVSLWSPDYNTGKRGLVPFQNLIESLFEIAGLDPTGMPGEPGKAKTARRCCHDWN